MKLLTVLAMSAILGGGAFGAVPSFGLLRSADAGRSWLETSQQFRSNRINALAVTGDHIWSGTDQGLFVSRDEGVNWTPGSSELTNSRVLCLVSGDGVTLAGTERTGIWRTIDNGQNWSRVAEAKYVRSLAWKGGSFWAGCDQGTVWASEDAGTHWQSMSDGLPPNRQIFELRSSPQGRLYAALYSNGFYELRERVWRRLGDVARPLVLFAGDDVLLSGQNPGGIYRSLDGGTSWDHVRGSVALNAPSWTFYEAGGTIYYGTTGVAGLFASRDRGQTWEPVAPDYLHNRAVVALASKGTTLYAATVNHPACATLENFGNGVMELNQ